MLEGRQEDEHLLTALGYVERNPLRAKLVRRAEDWRWGSCHVRQDRSHALRELLAPWPLPQPPRWLASVNLPQPPSQEKMMQDSIGRGRPLGDVAWVERITRRLSLQHTLRSIAVQRSG